MSVLPHNVHRVVHPHPWRALRAMTDWTLTVTALPLGILGLTDHSTRTIYLTRGMSQAQRRATLAHELEHARRPPATRATSALEEIDVDATTARLLIPFEHLRHAIVWCHTEDLGELADELWVDRATVATRLNHLHPAERHALARAVRAREGTDDER